MNENYDKAFEKVIGHEGGFQNDSRDRGNWTTGRIGYGTNKGTKYGVTAMAYPSLDIRNLTIDQAKEIYFKDYWLKAQCDLLPAGVDYLVFDAAVNHGPSQAAKFLQLAAGVSADGKIGPVTIRAVGIKDPKDLIQEFCVQRMIFYTRIGTFRVYGLGWTRRLVRTVHEAMEILNTPASQSRQAVPLDQSKTDPNQLDLFEEE